MENKLSHPFLKEANLSTEYVSSSFPLADFSAYWHPISETLSSWVLPDSEPITYEFNNLGYRGSWVEDDLPGSVWCFGDSQTAGLGVHEKDLWPTQLATLSKCKTINLGIAGASNDTIARTLISAITMYRPQAVCVLLSAPNRREIINEEGCSTLFPSAIKFLKNINKKLFKEYLGSTDSVSDQVNYDKNLLLIKSFCQAQHIPVVVADFTIPIHELAQTNPALDGFHLGPQLQRMIANYYSYILKDVL